MAKENMVWEVIKEAGYHPIENKNIIVNYAPKNLSESIVKFLQCSNEFFVLQVCEEALVLVPFAKWMGGLKREVTLEIPLNTINQIEISPSGLNYLINIVTETEELTLSTQQKELSDLRLSAAMASNGLLGMGKNWHKKNLDETLELLEKLIK